MLRTRLIVGTILAALALAMILVDELFAPWFPFLIATVGLLTFLATLELVALLPSVYRPNRAVALGGVWLIVLSAWAPIFLAHSQQPTTRFATDPTWWVLSAVAVSVITAFLYEMATFREPGLSVPRLALTVFTFAYLGVLPAYLAMIRTSRAFSSAEDIRRATYAIALAVFVPKVCDIGAYFTGRFLGRHKMAPVLSPKKTWEGAAGGLVAAVVLTIVLNQYGAVIAGGLLAEIAFGLTVGTAGMLGDLAESLIKRDCATKDASQTVPGFGGVLDVVDAILFAAPVVYWWLR
jgi:phosphatidate cytidylyltransferase